MSKYTTDTQAQSARDVIKANEMAVARLNSLGVYDPRVSREISPTDNPVGFLDACQQYDNRVSVERVRILQESRVIEVKKAEKQKEWTQDWASRAYA